MNTQPASVCVCGLQMNPPLQQAACASQGDQKPRQSPRTSLQPTASPRDFITAREMAQTQRVSRCSTGTSPRTAAPPPGLSLCLFPALSDRPPIRTASILLFVLFSSPSVCICFAPLCQMARTFHLWR